jgi:hypothetical protein
MDDSGGNTDKVKKRSMRELTGFIWLRIRSRGKWRGMKGNEFAKNFSPTASFSEKSLPPAICGLGLFFKVSYLT